MIEALARMVVGEPVVPVSALPVEKSPARLYAGAKVDTLHGGFGLGTSADSEILVSLRVLRSRSRELVRDNDYAKSAQRVIVTNVIGGGVGLQAKVSKPRGKLDDDVNDAIEECWEAWANKKHCDVSGRLHFADIERLLIASLVENGEVIVRKVRKPFGGSKIPLSLEIIEADRLMDQWQTAQAPNGNRIRMGVEVDDYYRPVAYWFHPVHPGDFQFQAFVPSAFIRVPADDIIHLYISDRPGQTRGVPWFHSCVNRLRNMGGYEEAEIIAAQATAAVVGLIESPDENITVELEDRRRVESFEPGTFRTLLPGEKFVGFNPSRPNAAMDPFMRYMLRGVASGVGMSYESLSRDYSQSNYSSSRLALLDDRALWRSLQNWYIRQFRAEIHAEWLDAAVLSGELSLPGYYANPRRYHKVRFKPRGWSWIDPAKEVQAYQTAVRNGFMTMGDVIAATADGRDFEDVMRERHAELEVIKSLGLVFDSDPAQVNIKGVAQPVAEPQPTDTPDAGDAADEDAEL